MQCPGQRARRRAGLVLCHRSTGAQALRSGPAQPPVGGASAMSLRAVVGAWRRSAVVALLQRCVGCWCSLDCAGLAQGYRNRPPGGGFRAGARPPSAGHRCRTRSGSRGGQAAHCRCGEKLVMTLKNWPPLRPLMLLALVLSVTGCAPTQTRWLAPQSPDPDAADGSPTGQRRRSACLHAQQG